MCADASILVCRYSKIKKLQKAVVWLKKFWQYLQGQNAAKEISVGEMESSLITLIKFVQRQEFEKEINALKIQQAIASSSQLKPLNPVLVDGIFRVGGRLEHASKVEKHPIILPNHHLTRLVIRDMHEQNAHIGSNQVMSKLREKYYILKAYSQIKAVLGKCIDCKKQQAKPAEQLMANLPKERVETDNPAFTYVGVDYFGQMQVK